MSNEANRKFVEGKPIYVVDRWESGDGAKAVEIAAKIKKVDEKSETFIAIVYDCFHNKYRFKDYGRLVFDTKEEARAAANELPVPNTTMYQIIGKRVYKKTVVGVEDMEIEDIENDGFSDLVVILNKGKSVPIEKIGTELFFCEADARKNKNKE